VPFRKQMLYCSGVKRGFGPFCWVMGIRLGIRSLFVK
jgi:hypothetical protein